MCLNNLLQIPWFLERLRLGVLSVADDAAIAKAGSPHCYKGRKKEKFAATKNVAERGLTTAVSDDQVPALLQVDGEEVGERAGEVTQAIAGFLGGLHGQTEKSSQLPWAPRERTSETLLNM